ncbi:MAG: acyltransferase [Proteobacteria bacterium]|nr:acyltransferase [Pseudomonadota bacterium]
MRIGIYQNHPRFGEVERNIDEAIQALRGVEADLMVMPELFNTGYQFLSRKELEELAEEVPSGKTTQALLGVSRSLGTHLVFGLAEREGAKCYNSAAVTGPQGFVGTYRKAHLFAEEKELFDPGHEGFRVFDLGRARIGLMVCFDWLFPEVARALALLGADILCHPANLVLPHCQKAMVTRSLENGVYSATANRIGTEARGGKKPLVFTGRSQILDHRGQVLASMGEGETGVAVVEVDIEKARDKRITEQNDRLADRRPELYGALLEKGTRT